MPRKLPPKIKIYEALGALADGRVQTDSLLIGKGTCTSSSTKGKYYTITFDESKNAIACNDSGSINQNYTGYPIIAFLLKIGKLSYNSRFLPMLKGINWQELKEKSNKNHEETERSLLGLLRQKEEDIDGLQLQVEQIYTQIKFLNLIHLREENQG